MLTGRLHFEPPLPPARDLYCQRQPTGAVIKVNAVYDHAFWRDDGLTGFSLMDVPPVKITYDNSPPGGRPGILVGFMEAADAIRHLQSPLAERRRATLEGFARAFGDRSLRPRRYLDKVWNRDRWTRGAYGGYHPPGVLSELGPELGSLTAPAGRVHFAGSDTSPVWTGYMDGAIASGIRVAVEVNDALG
jgi:monoamine oxidase